MRKAQQRPAAAQGHRPEPVRGPAEPVTWLIAPSATTAFSISGVFLTVNAGVFSPPDRASIKAPT